MFESIKENIRNNISNNKGVVRGLRRNLKLYDDYCEWDVLQNIKKECEIDKNFKIIKDNRIYCAYDSLKKLGIPMLDSNNKYRDLSNILGDLLKKFNSTYRSEKYNKRMKNRNKLYKKLKKLGRRL